MTKDIALRRRHRPQTSRVIEFVPTIVLSTNVLLWDLQLGALPPTAVQAFALVLHIPGTFL